MEYMIWETIVAILGIAMSLGYFPQVYRIWQKKEADDMSLITFSVFASGTCVWTIYGIVIGDWVVSSGFSVGMLGSWSVLGLTIRYRFFKKSRAQELDGTR